MRLFEIFNGIRPFWKNWNHLPVQRPDPRVILRLQRDLYHDEHGSVGTLTHDGRHLAHILEDPGRLPALRHDRSNEAEVLRAVEANKVYGETRIPAGLYRVTLRKDRGRYLGAPALYPHGVMELENVPGFLYIQIHPGNWPRDTLGCLMPGVWGGQNASVGQSRLTHERVYNEFLMPCQNGNLWIEIIDGPA